MFNRINKIIKALFNSAEGNTETKIDGGANVDETALHEVSYETLDRPHGLGYQDETAERAEGYSATDEEIDPSNTRNAKRW